MRPARSRRRTPSPRQGPESGPLLSDRPSSGSTHYAGASEAIVKATVIPREQGGKKSKAGRRREHQPYRFADDRAGHVERRSRLGGDHANPRGHLAERLPPRGERHEVAAVLDEQECDQRTPRKQCEILDRQAADLE